MQGDTHWFAAWERSQLETTVCKCKIYIIYTDTIDTMTETVSWRNIIYTLLKLYKYNLIYNKAHSSSSIHNNYLIIL